MSVNLLHGVEGEGFHCVPVPAQKLVAWLCMESGIRDLAHHRVQLDAASYAVGEGLIVEAYGKRYRLRVTAEQLEGSDDKERDDESHR